MRRPGLFVATLLLLAGIPAGCDSPGGGVVDRPVIPTDRAGPTASSGAPAPSEPVRPSSATVGPAGAATAALRPCDLLTDAERTEFAVVVLSEETLGYARFCELRARGQYVLGLAIFDTLRIEDVVASGAKKSIEVDGRAAVQYVGVLDSCNIAMRVSETSRVEVNVNAGGDTTKACSVARRAADRVEAKLP